jgi:hypothetical protein
VIIDDGELARFSLPVLLANAFIENPGVASAHLPFRRSGKAQTKASRHLLFEPG